MANGLALENCHPLCTCHSGWKDDPTKREFVQNYPDKTWSKFMLESKEGKSACDQNNHGMCVINTRKHTKSSRAGGLIFKDKPTSWRGNDTTKKTQHIRKHDLFVQHIFGLSLYI